MPHFNKLEPEEAERLALLLEEMGEAQQAVGKILRHGYKRSNSYDRYHTKNRDLLEEELGHVLFVVGIMATNGDLSPEKIREHVRDKADKDSGVWKYLHHNTRVPPHKIFQ